MVKLIKIVKASKNKWYADKIGLEYPVIGEVGKVYTIRGGVVLKSDCKVIIDTTTQLAEEFKEELDNHNSEEVDFDKNMMYATKTEAATKFDSGKPDFTQLPQVALLEVAKVFTYGGQKYGEFNYSGGMEVRRHIAAANRHMNQFLRGEDIDESGTHHLSNAISDLMMALEDQLLGKGIDNRNKIYAK